MPPAPAIDLPVGSAGVRRIGDLTDPVLRNLWITASYHDLATRMIRQVGGRDVTWCGFAVWASRGVGQILRGDVPIDPRVLGGVPARAVHLLDLVSRFASGVVGSSSDLLDSLIVRLMGRTNEALATGNRDVFLQLAPLYVSLLEALEAPVRPAPAAFDEVMGAAVAEQERLDPAGGDELRAAFQGYWQAAFEDDPDRQARLVFVANVRAVANEQRRLQPLLAQALDPGLDELLHECLGANPRLVLRPFVRVASNDLARMWRDTVTSVVAQLEVGVTKPERFDLGQDVPPFAGGDFAPADVLAPPETDVDAVKAQWDRGDRNAVRDWSDLQERMAYVFRLFLNNQRLALLLEAPFDDAQLADLGRLVVPRPVEVGAGD